MSDPRSRRWSAEPRDIAGSDLPRFMQHRSMPDAGWWLLPAGLVICAALAAELLGIPVLETAWTLLGAV